MSFNKKSVYVGVTLFSALILTSLSDQTVNADTLSASTASTVATAKTPISTGAVTGVSAPAVKSASSTTTSTVSSIPAKTSTAVTTTAVTLPTKATTTGTVSSVKPGTTSTSSTTTTTTSTTSSAGIGFVTQPVKNATPPVISPATKAPLASTTKPATTSSTVSSTTKPVAKAPVASSTTKPTVKAPLASSTTKPAAKAPATKLPAKLAAKVPSSKLPAKPAAKVPATKLPAKPATKAPAAKLPSKPAAKKPATALKAVDPYAIPSGITKDTVVDFGDQTMGDMVRYALGLKGKVPVTVGDIESFNNPVLGVNETLYEMYNPVPGSKSTVDTNVTDQSVPAIETLNGIQYLQLLPTKTQVYLQLKLASDAKANEDLRPLDKLNLGHLVIDGNYSDPKAKQINLAQLNKIPTTNLTYLELTGDKSVSTTSGLNNKELAQIAPTIIKWATAPSGFRSESLGNTNLFELGNSSISDFRPLKGTEAGKNFTVVAATDVLPDAKPVYAVANQPISFKAPKVLDLDGKDLAANYHFTYNVDKAELADDDLVNKGDDNYEILKPSQGTTNLVYGYLGWAYSSNPDSYVMKTSGGTTFESIITNVQPLVWQAHPTVTIRYVDSSGKALTDNGKPIIKVIDGKKIGDAFDLTADSKVAGYNLASSTKLLKGAFSQNPQVIKLVYAPVEKANPVVAKPEKVIHDEVLAAPQSTLPVQVYDDAGEAIPGEKTSLRSARFSESAMIAGKHFYKLSDHKWVLAGDFNVYQAKTGIVRTFGAESALVDGSGEVIKSQLSPNTEWKYDKVITIKDKQYYEVATNEYLATESAVEFAPIVSGTAVTTRAETVVYDSQGQRLSTMLPAKSSWKSDGTAVIKGVPMYRVANDEWIAVQDVDTFIPISTVYVAQYDTPTYNIDGNMLPLSQMLKVGTAWKVDRLVTINGQEYYRLAPNVFVEDYATDVKTSEGFLMPASTNITLAQSATIYDSKGAATAKTLPAGTIRRASAEEVMKGVPLYQIAPNEWIRLSDIYAYNQVSNKVIHTVANVQLYNDKGQLLTGILQSGSDWRTGKTITVAGQRYLRVATDEYVKAL